MPRLDHHEPASGPALFRGFLGLRLALYPQTEPAGQNERCLHVIRSDLPWSTKGMDELIDQNSRLVTG
jgi:hypothetical protein